MGLKYRADIDGLRSIAVLSVILFHAKIAGFGGGYLGVDIFFVISGFLITGILVRDSHYDIVKFYDRRIRRIAPALLLVMVASAPFVYLLSFISQYLDYRASVRGVLLFYSNIVFYRQTGYFQDSAELKPLIHTWSLAVEEQFYILYPIFLSVAARLKGRGRLYLAILAFFVSLGISQWGAYHAQSANFFLLPSRAWELLAGAISALYLNENAKPVSNVGSLIGAVLVLGSIFVFNDTTPSPSGYTLVPVLGTVLLLHFGDRQTWTGRILSNPVQVGIGLISYSLYLWHQPLFALARLHMATPPTAMTYAILTFLSIGMAILSWRFVEQPCRNSIGIWRGRSFYPVIAALTLGLFAFSYLPNRPIYSSADAVRYSAFADYQSTPTFRAQYSAGTCFVLGGAAKFDRRICLTPTSRKRHVLLIGDSHAAHLSAALKSQSPDIQVLQASFAQCSSMPFRDKPGYCLDDLSYAYDLALQHRQIDSIILSLKWDDVSLDKVSALVKRLKSRVRVVTVIGPTPEYKMAVPLILARAVGNTRQPLDEVLYLFRDTRFIRHDTQFRAAVERAGGDYIDPMTTLCGEARCRAVADDGSPMYFDTDHLTKSGAETFVRLIRRSASTSHEALFNQPTLSR